MDGRSRILPPPMPAPSQSEPPPRIRINYPAPTVDGGRYAVKRCVGDSVTVSADIFRDGHEILRAVVALNDGGSPDAALAPDLFAAVERHAERHGATRLSKALALEVDRLR